MNVLKPNKQATIVTLLERGTPQREIARITGIDRKTINRIENGHFSPALDTLVRLGVALGVKPSDFLKH